MDFNTIKALPEEDLVHALLMKMSKEELYDEAMKLKKPVQQYDLDAEKYHMYIIMSANYGYQLAKDEFYDYYYKQLSTVAFKPYPMKLHKAEKFYENTKDYSYSSFLLGEMYHNGNYVEKDYKKARELYDLAIEQDTANTFAYWNIALMYDHGLGVDQDEKLSRKYYRLYEQKKSPYSVYRAACSILKQDNGRKWRQAEKRFKEAASMGYTKALDELGKLYKNMRYKNRVKKNVIEYFIEIGEVDRLKDIYGYDDNSIYIMKQNGELKKQSEAIDLGLYLKSLTHIPNNICE